MKTIFKILSLLLMLSVGSLLTSCRSKEEPLPPPKPLSLSMSTVSMKVGNSQTVTISGGNGTYELVDQASYTSFLELRLSGSTLTLKALKAGQVTLIIRSKGSQDARLSVTITEEKVELARAGYIGILDANKQALLEPKYKSQKLNLIYLSPSPKDIYGSYLIIYLPDKKVKVGESLPLSLKAKNIRSLPNGELNWQVKVEVITNGIVQTSNPQGYKILFPLRE